MFRNEIGSEFWDIPSTTENNNLFPKETNWFISGRSALLAILKENKFRTAALPYWCCDSMIMPFVIQGIKVQFYNEQLPQTDVALVMDYFGYVGTGASTEGYKGVVIRDLTHSIFSSTYSDADYYFGSLRKWAGFLTGGFAWGFKQEVKYEEDNSKYVGLRKRAMNAKKAYINEISNDKGYLNIYNQAEELLEDIGVAKACDEDITVAKKIDIDYIISKRRCNANIVLEALSNVAIYPVVDKNDCPMFVPIRVKKRDALRKHLISKEIYCPVHWPISELHNITNDEMDLYDEELSIVCDQRYSPEDMKRIIYEIKKFYSED